MNNVFKSFIMLLLILPFSGCAGEQEDVTFKSVDCSIYYDNLKSIKVLENGRAYLRIDRKSGFGKNLLERSEFYSVLLGKNQMDSISKMATTLLRNGIDSLFESTGNNGVSICIIISSDVKRLPATGNNNRVKDYKPMYRLVNYLDEVSQKVKLETDTAFIFASRNYFTNTHNPEFN